MGRTNQAVLALLPADAVAIGPLAGLVEGPEGPQARLWACGAEITIAVARGPRGAYAFQWADPSMPQAACDGALAKCRATYPPGDFGGARVWLALVIDARRGLMYQH